MLISKSNRKFLLTTINFHNLTTFNPTGLGLEKDKDSGLYIYKSQGYNILNWKVKPKILINLTKSDEYLRLSLNNKNISGLGKLSQLITVEIDTIIKRHLDDCLIERLQVAV